MTKNERIEKRAVKLWASEVGVCPLIQASCWHNTSSDIRAHWMTYARKLIRLEDKVKALTPKKTRKKFIATFRCGVCKSRLPKGATACEICGATDHDE